MRWTRRGGGGAWSAAAAVLLAVCAGSLVAQQSPPAPPGPPAPPPLPHFVVVIDAAHGGDDTGGHLNSGQMEKAATLAFSVRLRSLLSARGIQVVTTRESDQSLNPDQRAEIANRARAQACISLHAAETGSGVHMFVSSLAPSASTRFMPWKTAQSGFVTRSLALAGMLNSVLNHGGTNVTLGRTSLPGIDSMACPAVAIELAPSRDADKKTISEPDDANYEAQIASTLAAAILEWRADDSRAGARQP